jgi:phosphohistidine phosphatase
MALYLVQHGKNTPKDQDPEQHLSAQGREEVQRIAKAADAVNLPLQRIQHSPKTRAKETAEIFASSLRPAQGIQEREGIKALDDVTAISSELNGDQELMLVGHLPFMERLCTYLITGYQEPSVIAFQNGGIVCLEQDPESGNWRIRWTLLPSVI